ncbi:hypothetical protein OIU74_024469, partial [Salix koriyanagi]
MSLFSAAYEIESALPKSIAATQRFPLLWHPFFIHQIIGSTRIT